MEKITKHELWTKENAKKCHWNERPKFETIKKINGICSPVSFDGKTEIRTFIFNNQLSCYTWSGGSEKKKQCVAALSNCLLIFKFQCNGCCVIMWKWFSYVFLFKLRDYEAIIMNKRQIWLNTLFPKNHEYLTQFHNFLFSSFF